MTTSVERDVAAWQQQWYDRTVLAGITGEGEAGCEAVWPESTGKCNKPASWLANVHSTELHVYGDSRLCADCLTKIKGLGFHFPNLISCECKATPLIKSWRPI